MKYTLKQCKKDMCQMWKWLSENQGESKETFRFSHPDYKGGNCAACKYTEQFKGDCGYCPVNWENDCGESVFSKWIEATIGSEQEAIYAREVYKLALQIKV